MSNGENQFFYKNNRLQQLRGFCAAMQFGTLSKAANHLGLSHTAISLQIKSLEDDLKVQLFERKGPKIKPTKEAALLYNIANQHVQVINGIFDEFVTQKNEDLSDEINIAANNSSLSYILPKLMKYYLKENPHIYPRIHFSEQEEGLEKLKKEEIDVLILPRREHRPIDLMFFEYTPMFYYAPVLFTLYNHPLAGKKKLTLEEICRYEFTLPSKGLTSVPYLDDIFKKYKIDKRFRIRFEDWSVARKYVEEGLVISIGADISHEGKRDVLCKTPLSHLFPVIDYGFVTMKNKKKHKKLLSLFELAKKHSPEISSDILPGN